ncbi:pyridoxamine 5'-phosphate oxidase family protein [Paracidobacterium acidisoli]|uniref:Pyridoxamine 5'-phosphate oxidase family protein n=1 Tax=Paracidobacterium acidisoli TaxID=2303751 RepID=A0A372IMG5_9BACT|nr:pyridoxamine 5'-phosphate oxidase family protein [Paracidobacterium acidisoli]MBT9331736.1 pyridoxamine 5'-phosphate oxidase family protein [Paracidobacterium acidisoli]
MGKQFSSIEPAHREFIERQRIFFAASATADSRINVSPRGTDSLRILSDHAAAYLDLTGSGSETSAHLRIDGRLTLMFCALEGAPTILRLYGRGRSLRRGTAEYAALLASNFDGKEMTGARQIVVLDVDLVQTSCGYGVPFFTYAGERNTLARWAEAKGDEGLEEYRRRKNMRSLDGLSTGLFDDKEALTK